MFLLPVRAAAALLAVLTLSAILPQTVSAAECGRASWYALTGRTASGQKANPNGYYAAHRTLPFGTKVEVTDQSTGKSVEVTINDRGPFVGKRIIDLSKGAAAALGFQNKGVTSVCIAQR